jgi:integrase
MARFTDLGVTRIRPKKTKTTTTEGNGLYLQISPKGKKTWLHLHRTENARKWINLGEFPDMSVADARKRNEEAARYSATDTTGQALNFNSTLEDLFKEWHSKAVDKRGKPWSAAHKRNVEYMFKADVLPSIGDMRLRDIRKRDIRVLLEKIEERAPNQALQVYRRLSRLFNYAASKDIIEANPMSALETIGSSTAKDRHLTAKEIKTFLDALPSADMAPDTARVLELILRTGQRPSEVCGANTDEMQGNWWVLPGTRTKNGLEQRVPLTKTIKALFGTANKHGLFFPSPKEEKNPLAAMALSKALRRSLTGNEKKPDDDQITIPIKAAFTPHDLRRTCATGLGALGFSIEVIASVLNHKPRTVTGIHYMLHQYDIEKRKALEAWERRLKTILTAKKGNVVPMTRRA